MVYSQSGKQIILKKSENQNFVYFEIQFDHCSKIVIVIWVAAANIV